MTGAIILAAGASTRLGTPKQIMLYNGKTLLQHAADAARNAGCQPVVVVLGGNADAILPGFKQEEIIVIYHDEWQQGMGSSIAAGTKALLKANGAASSVITMVCDQPFADAALLQTLMQQMQQTGKGIAASAYAGTVGVPALFNKKYFDALMQLGGDEGAKKLMMKYKEDVAEVPFEKGIIDIDTIEDMERFREGK